MRSDKSHPQEKMAELLQHEKQSVHAKKRRTLIEGGTPYSRKDGDVGLEQDHALGLSTPKITSHHERLTKPDIGTPGRKLRRFSDSAFLVPSDGLVEEVEFERVFESATSSNKNPTADTSGVRGWTRKTARVTSAEIGEIQAQGIEAQGLQAKAGRLNDDSKPSDIRPVEFSRLMLACTAGVPTEQPQKCQQCVRFYDPLFACPFHPSFQT